MVLVSFRPLHFKVWGLVFSSATNWTVFSLVCCFFMFCKKRMWRGKKQQRAPLIDIDRTGPRGRHLWSFSAGEMTPLWTVDRQHVHGTAAVFMTTALLKCSFSHFWLHCQVYANLRGDLISFFMLLPILSCFSYTHFPIRLDNLSISFINKH